MEFAQLLEIVGDEPVFETGLLLAGPVDAGDVRRQLSRWTRAGRLYQLRRGLYVLAPPYQKAKPHPFEMANRMVRASYVSCQSALAHAGLIPEYVPVTVSVTTRRPAHWNTLLGEFRFHHVTQELWNGYRAVDMGSGRIAFVATPAKALLDLVYLTPGADSRAYLKELRLQNLELVDPGELTQLASANAKLRRAARTIVELRETEMREYITL